MISKKKSKKNEKLKKFLIIVLPIVFILVVSVYLILPRYTNEFIENRATALEEQSTFVREKGEPDFKVRGDELRYNVSWGEINITLDRFDKDWIRVTDIFIKEEKFGGNITGKNTTQQVRYSVKTDSELIKGKGFVYYIERLTPVKCGSVDCINSEKHRIDFADVCTNKINRTIINTTTEEEDGTILFNTNCVFNQIDAFNLELEFDAEYNSTSDMILIDPTITIVDVDSYSPTIKNNITTEARPFSHITMNDSTSIHDSLLMYLPFDINDGSDNITYDYSLNQTDFTLAAGSAAPTFNESGGVYGSAYVFDGDSQEMTSFDFTPPINGTVMMWINPTTVTGGDSRRIFGSGDFFEIRINPSTAVLNCELFASTQSDDLMVAGIWQHIACAWTASAANTRMVYYINGVEAFDDVENVFVDPGTATLKIGVREGSGDHYPGMIDDLMMFNRTLSATEIGDIFNNLSYRFLTPATQLFQNVNFTQGGSDNKVNITTNTTFDFGTGMQLRIVEFDDGTEGDTSAWQSIVAGDNQLLTFDMSTSTNNLTLEFNFTTDINNFYSPVLRDNIDVETFGGAAGPDTEDPVVTLVYPANASTVNNESVNVFFNATATDNINVSIMALHVWNSTSNTIVNQTNVSTSGITVGVNISVLLPYEDTFFWNYRAYDNASTQNSAFASSNFTFTFEVAAEADTGFFEDWEDGDFDDWHNTGWAIATDRFLDVNSSKCAETINCDMNTSGSINTSGVGSVNVSFSFNDDDMDSNDATMYWNDSSGNWDSIALIDAGSLGLSDDVWNNHSNSSTDSQYFHSGFAIRFFATPETGGGANAENYWIDNINVTTVAAAGDTCTYTSGNFAPACSDNCSINTNITIDAGSNVSLRGSGIFQVQAGSRITNYFKLDTQRSCLVRTYGIGGFFQTILGLSLFIF